jgi:5-methylcytosine-specific restriction enzyme A
MGRRLTSLRPRIAAAARRVRGLKKTADPLYLSLEWRALVARIMAARGRRCEKCGRTHDRQGEPIRIFGDHVKELKDGGALLDPSNVQLLCGSCHQIKSNDERARQMARRY